MVIFRSRARCPGRTKGSLTPQFRLVGPVSTRRPPAVAPVLTGVPARVDGLLPALNSKPPQMDLLRIRKWPQIRSILNAPPAGDLAPRAAPPPPLLRRRPILCGKSKPRQQSKVTIARGCAGAVQTDLENLITLKSWATVAQHWLLVSSAQRLRNLPFSNIKE